MNGIAEKNKSGELRVADGYHIVERIELPKPTIKAPVFIEDFLSGLTQDDFKANERLREEVELWSTLVTQHIWHVCVSQRNDRDAYTAKMEAFKNKYLYQNIQLPSGETVVETYQTRDGQVKAQYAPIETQHSNLVKLLQEMKLSPTYKAELTAKAKQRVKQNAKSRLLANGMSEDGRGLEKRPGYANGDVYTLNQLEEDMTEIENQLKRLEGLSATRPWTHKEEAQYLNYELGLARCKVRIHELQPFVDSRSPKQKAVEAAIAFSAPN